MNENKPGAEEVLGLKDPEELEKAAGNFGMLGTFLKNGLDPEVLAEMIKMNGPSEMARHEAIKALAQRLQDEQN